MRKRPINARLHSGLFVFSLLLLPTLARSELPSCGLSYEMQQAELPSDIAVRVDSLTRDATKVAMDWWVARLSIATRTITWHEVENTNDCMIYVRHGWDLMMPGQSTAGYTHPPNCKKYSGVATVKLINPWVVAHEIGHLFGCKHGAGVMREEWTGETELWIDNDALHRALLARYEASSLASRQIYSRVRPIGYR